MKDKNSFEKGITGNTNKTEVFYEELYNIQKVNRTPKPPRPEANTIRRTLANLALVKDYK